MLPDASASTLTVVVDFTRLILSKSGAYADGLPNWIVFDPALSVTVTINVPGVLKLPVGVNDNV